MIKSKNQKYNIGEAALQPGIDMGNHELYTLLKEHGIVDRHNKPFQEYIDKGLFENHVKIQPWNGKGYNVTLVTQEGLEFIKQLKIQGKNF